MADAVIQARGLTKRYGPGIGVVELDLTVPRGQVYGLLGPNGAGKTTTMRMIVGLVRPTSGELTVLGAAPGSTAALAGTGALIEAPALYPHLSGRDNLRLLARYRRIGRKRVEDVLDEVGLADRADGRFRQYSLGMRQRLGVAAALLGDPDLLILDEPTNGLDPAGIAAMRDLVALLRRHNRTVLLSSHHLPEVEELCDRVAVLNRGRLVAEGDIDTLRGRATRGELLIRVDDRDAARSVLDSIDEVRDATADGELLRVAVDPGLAARINAALVGAGVGVLELRPAGRSLQDVFFALTGQAERHDEWDAEVVTP